MSDDKFKDVSKDIGVIEKQEELLQFDVFDNQSAWLLGNAIKARCESCHLVVCIEIRLCGQTVYFYAMPGTSAYNADWARRKRNTTELMQRSSYAVGLSLTRDGETLAGNSGLCLRDYAQHGGSVPIRVKGVGCIGAATVSGLPQREDHKLVVSAMGELMGISMAFCSLD